MIDEASFLLADADNIGHLLIPSKYNAYGASISASVYRQSLNHDSAVFLNDSGKKMKGIIRAIGINFINPGKTSAVVSYPDGLSNNKVTSYPLRRLDGTDVVYKAGYFGSFGYSQGQTVVEGYKLCQDGFFRRNSFKPADPTIQEEMVRVLDRLPSLPHNLSEKTNST